MTHYDGRVDFQQLMQDREFSEKEPDVWEKVNDNATLNIYCIEHGKTYTFIFKNELNQVFRNRLDLVGLKSFLEHWDYLNDRR